ncbi:MAG TPA: hypothetical protein VIF62_27065 [Labilithrix sp.]|jgi:hypothetical protein
MNLRSLLVGFFLGAVDLAACTTGQKKDVAKTAFDAMSVSERRDAIEATVRVTDEKPEIVDELYAAARRHPKTLDRFLANTARDLHDPALAKPTAELLVANPDSLEEMFVLTPDLALHSREARAAMDRAMARRAGELDDILTDDPTATARVTGALLELVEKKPAARKSLLAAMRANRKAIVALVERDPELARELAEPVLAEFSKDKPLLRDALRAAKIVR